MILNLNLNLHPPYLAQFHHQSLSNLPLSFVILPFCTYNFKNSHRLKPKSKASSSSSHREVKNAEKLVSELFLDSELWNRISSVKNADEVLMIIREESGKSGGVVSSSDCSFILKAAFDKNNVELALLVYDAMQKTSFNQGVSETGALAERWKWDRPDVLIYSLLVRGLASALRVSDAIRIIYDVCQIGVYSGEEVSFGKVVRCPSCMIAVAVVQPQHGIQIASCSKCRYQYELFSGNIITIESEQISMDTPAWERGLRFLNIMKQSVPAAVHSIVVQAPSGIARTHKFATKTVKLPAQEGERVTISLAAPSSVYREVGPLRLNSKAPGFNPGEAMCLTNHTNGQESELLRAPVKNENLSISNPSILFPVLALLTTGNFATGMIDPTLPQFISIAAVTSIALGTTINSVVLPQLNRLPQRTVDVLAIKQQLLSQYDLLQNRIKGLREAAEKEVWMLARMCQLENKIVAVGEPSYRARRSRIKKVRESLESSLIGRIELIDSYAKISSMIEIEVEMDSDVIAAESASNAENIAEQIEQIMELENLEEKWKMQAEANDEVERLLSSQPIPTEQL